MTTGRFNKINFGDGLAVTDDGNHEITVTATASSAKTVQIKVNDDTTRLATGDGQMIFAISSDMNAFSLIDADAYITTSTSVGTVAVQIRNVTLAGDMLTTKITIDAGEYTSYSGGTQAVINSGTATVATGDRIAVDVDSSGGTQAMGFGVVLRFG